MVDPTGGDTLFVGVRLLDPATGLDQRGELLIRDGRIADFGAALGRPDGARVIEGEDGAVLCPGLVDLRAALGEPGAQHRAIFALDHARPVRPAERGAEIGDPAVADQQLPPLVEAGSGIEQADPDEQRVAARGVNAGGFNHFRPRAPACPAPPCGPRPPSPPARG